MLWVIQRCTRTCHVPFLLPKCRILCLRMSQRDDLLPLSGSALRFRSSSKLLKKAEWKPWKRRERKKRRSVKRKIKYGIFGLTTVSFLGSQRMGLNPSQLQRGIYQLMLKVLIHQRNTYSTRRKSRFMMNKMRPKGSWISFLVKLMLWGKFHCTRILLESTLSDVWIFICALECSGRRLIWSIPIHLFRSCPHLVIWDPSLPK